jgi:hypothetical protein
MLCFRRLGAPPGKLHKPYSGKPISGLRKSSVSVDAPWGDLRLLGEAGMSLYNRSITLGSEQHDSLGRTMQL